MNKQPKFNKWLSLINIPIQMGAIIFIASWIGQWLDENHPSPKVYYSKCFVIFGVFIAIYNVYVQVTKIKD